MKTVTVNASHCYDVHIGSGIASQIGSWLSGVTKGQTLAIVSDSHVWPLHGASLLATLEAAGYRCCTFVFPAGEESKSGETYLRLLNFLAQEQLTRSDCLIALGGGVVGDLAGFAAATYLRGIGCVQVPTTLLAAVDSSVGGKTAIDLPAGKNLAGAFYQPRLVVCDTDAFATLPEAVFRAGCGEIIKYAMLYDEALFRHLESCGPAFSLEYVVSCCVEWKRQVVSMDEFDRGARQQLNLGHTLGHGIEQLSGFCIPHGEAVAIGMAIITRASAAMGYCDPQVSQRLTALLERFQLPHTTEYDAASLYRAALSDKKRQGDTLTLVIPERIGQCRLLPIPISQLQTWIEAGL